MLKQNGMIMLSERELETIIQERIEEVELRNALLREAVLELTRRNCKDSKEIKDVRISKVDFLQMYNEALDDMFENPENNDIYGYDITVHWHGIYCNCGDGATPCNHIIPAIVSCYEEDNEEY